MLSTSIEEPGIAVGGVVVKSMTSPLETLGSILTKRARTSQSPCSTEIADELVSMTAASAAEVINGLKVLP